MLILEVGCSYDCYMESTFSDKMLKYQPLITPEQTFSEELLKFQPLITPEQPWISVQACCVDIGKSGSC